MGAFAPVAYRGIVVGVGGSHVVFECIVYAQAFRGSGECLRIDIAAVAVDVCTDIVRGAGDQGREGGAEIIIGIRHVVFDGRRGGSDTVAEALLDNLVHITRDRCGDGQRGGCGCGYFRSAYGCLVVVYIFVVVGTSSQDEENR